MRRNRVLFLVLVFTLIITMIPVTAFAEGATVKMPNAFSDANSRPNETVKNHRDGVGYLINNFIVGVRDCFANKELISAIGVGKNSTRLSTPVVSKSNNSTTGKPRLTWKKVTGAAKYEIYRYDIAKKAYVKMFTTTNLNYTNTSAEAGKTYYYKVKAISSSSSVKASITGGIKITCKYPTPQVTGSHDASSGKCKLTWTRVTGATKYEIYRYDSAKKEYVKYYTTTSTGFTNSSAQAGSVYYYKVKAVGSVADAASRLSDSVRLICRCATPKVTGNIDSVTGKPKLTWSKVGGAAKYEVYRYSSATDTYVKMYTTTGTSYINTSAEAGKAYWYKVKSIGSAADAASQMSTSVKLTCKCAAPKVTGSTDTNGKPKLTWSKVDGATKYDIYRYDSVKKEYVKYYTTTSTSFTNSSAQAGSVYYYKVKAMGATSESNSAMSASIRLTCLNPNEVVVGGVRFDLLYFPKTVTVDEYSEFLCVVPKEEINPGDVTYVIDEGRAQLLCDPNTPNLLDKGVSYVYKYYVSGWNDMVSYVSICYDPEMYLKYRVGLYKGHKKGSFKVSAYYKGKHIRTSTVNVTGTDEDLVEMRKLMAEIESKAWTSNMTAVEKLNAIDSYISENYKYEDGYTCVFGAQALLFAARDLGLNARYRFVGPNYDYSAGYGDEYYHNGAAFAGGHVCTVVTINGQDMFFEAQGAM